MHGYARLIAVLLLVPFLSAMFTAQALATFGDACGTSSGMSRTDAGSRTCTR